MKTRWFWILILVTLLISCQGANSTPSSVPISAATPDTPAVPSPASTGTPIEPTRTHPVDRVQPSLTPSGTVVPTVEQTPIGTQIPTAVPRQLFPFTVNISAPFAATNLAAWQPHPYSGIDYSLPFDLSQIVNPQVITGLTDEQRALLVQNGCVVIPSQEAQFKDIRDGVSKHHGQPYFLTTDAAFHAVHLTFDYLLKGLEREQLRPGMIAITQALLDEVLSFRPNVEGTTIESDTRLSVAYLSVALKLFEPEAEIDPSVANLVSQQVEQILAGAGRENSALIPSFEDDYGAYKPVGHYAGDPELEQYFRGMTWFGRVHFNLFENNPAFVPSRAPLIITLALRRAPVQMHSAAEAWATIHEVLTFLIGPTDDAGPIEYAALMDQVYGDSLTPEELADDALWQTFLSMGQQIPAPQINSTFVDWVDPGMEEERGWRFLGQRFTLDGFIFQNLVFDKVEPMGEKRRLFPTGLDVMAAMGSRPALDALDAMGETAYPNYLEQMAILQDAVQAQPEEQWLNRFYEGWLFTFFPILASKEGGYPSYMQTDIWGLKDLNTALGSWAELKHDTVLYTKMPEAAGGGGPPSSGPAPGYVEPNPDVFYRLATLTQILIDGPSQRDMLAVGQGGSFSALSLGGLEREMNRLSERLYRFGDIAAKELAGEALDEEDLEAIQGCLGLIECLMEDDRSGTQTELPAVPVIAAVAGGGSLDDRVLEVGVGYVDRIYVIVPVDGICRLLKGAFSRIMNFSNRVRID